jgi:cell division protein FtsI/penicillin-binding protein 2
LTARVATGGAGYPREGTRRVRLRNHLLPLLVAAGAAFTAGIVIGASHEPAERRLAEEFTRAWARGDLRSMYDSLSDDAKGRVAFGAFRDAYAADAATATATAVRAGEPSDPADGVVTVPMTVRTRVFGVVRAPLALRIAGEGDAARIDWHRTDAFPGVPESAELRRRTRLPTRATLLAADGTRLAAGADRTSEAPDVSASIVGSLGPIPPERTRELKAKGVPADAQVGLTGLERALDDELRGRPGGTLLAGDRALARSAPSPADPVRSTIVPSIQRAAVTALAGRLGGVVALHPRTGAVQAAAGIGFSGLQPPGSTFKIITMAAGLQEGVVRTTSRFPVETYATLEGVKLSNANGESCGGNLMESFAHSCNSVFAPLGAKLGARRLVEMAERFGFNKPPGIDGAATSTIPSPTEIGDDLAVGSTAIGQGRVQATALQMAIAAATIGEHGQRPQPTLLAGRPPIRIRAIPSRVAVRVGRGMRYVVIYGTGTAAAIDGVKVAGKTGTAELRSTQSTDPTLPPPPTADPSDTDAWFAAYAPAGRPKTAVGVLLVGSGAGGATAAPAARGVLLAALERDGAS